MTIRMYKTAQKLLNAAHAFWEASWLSGSHGAVRWLEDDQGRLLIYSRGEYREQLLRNIHGANLEIESFDLIENEKPSAS